MARSLAPTVPAHEDFDMSASSSDSGSSSSSLTGGDESRLAVIFCYDGSSQQIDAPWDDARKLWDLAARVFHLDVTDVQYLHHIGH